MTCGASLLRPPPTDINMSAAPTIDTTPAGDLVIEGLRTPETFSHSSMSTFASCPAAWALARSGVEGEASRRARVGVVVHEVLDALSSGGDDADPAATITAVLADDPDDLVGEVTELVESCGDFGLVDPHRSGLRETEVELTAEVEGWPVVGYVDAVDVDDDGAVVIVDYKTGRTPSPVSAAVEDWDGGGDIEAIYSASVTRQVILYAILARISGLPVDRVRLVYLKSRQAIGVDLDTPRGELLMLEARRFVDYEAARMVDAVDSGLYRARPTEGRCRNCDHRAACPLRGDVPVAVAS